MFRPLTKVSRGQVLAGKAVFLINHALRILFPENCGICHHLLEPAERFVCQTCWEKIELSGSSLCPRCGGSFASEHAVSYSPEHLCAFCRQKRVPFETAKAVGPYRGILKEMIHLFKYRGKMGLGIHLAELMADQFFPKFSHLLFDLVLPVPLNPRKLREREFDQSQILAEHLSQKIGVPPETENLARIRWTESQVGLSRKERIKNVQGAFILKTPSRIKEQRILLVDDVYTTGATITECAAVLKAKGAARIDIFTLARA